MGFFKELKEDFSQAMNDFMPEDDFTMEDSSEDIKNDVVNNDEKENDDSKDSKIEEIENELSKNPINEENEDKTDLEEEVLAAINALNTDDNPSNEELTEEELIQRMIDEDERIKKEQEQREQDQKEQEIKEEELKKQMMEEKEMAQQVENKDLNSDDEKDMELIAQLLGEDNTEDVDIDEEILASNENTEVMIETPAEEKEAFVDVNRERKEDVTVITKGTKINGSISSDGSLEVMGTINGDIECLGKLSIIGNVNGNSQASEIYVNTARLDGGLVSEGSVKVGVGTIVVGDIKASSAVIAGAIKGEVDVNGPVVIDSTAIVKGNINAKSVQINNGAVVDGYCSLSYASVDIDNFFDGEK